MFTWTYVLSFWSLLLFFEASQVVSRFIPATILSFKDISSQQQFTYWGLIAIIAFLQIEADLKLDTWIAFRNLLKPTKIVSQRMFTHLMGLDLAWHTSKSSGAISASISKGIARMTDLVRSISFEFLPAVFQLIVSIIPLAIYTPITVLPLLGAVSVYLGLTLWDGKITKPYREKVNLLEEESNAWMVQMLQGLPDILFSGNPEYFVDLYQNLAEEIYVAEAKGVKLHLLVVGRIKFYLAKLSELGLLYLMFREFEAGRISSVIFFGNAAVVLTLFAVINKVSRIADVVYNTSPAILATNNLMLAKPKIIEGKIDKVPQGDILIEDLCFGYSPDKMVFDNLSFTISLGKIAAFVGESGSGKSTLLKLLLRQYDIQSGAISIGNTNIVEYLTRPLQYFYVYVPQKPYTFGQSVRDNVLMGNLSLSLNVKNYRELSQAEINLGNDVQNICSILQIVNPESIQVDDLVWLALKKVGLNTLFTNLDQKIGERGMTLSGGEAQRLAMARALIKSWLMLSQGLVPTILLDEPTSALDGNSERVVMSGIEFLNELGCTVIIIAHRLSTIQNADTIYVFEGGKLVEQGNHLALLSTEGLYYKMVNPTTHQEENY